VAEDVRYRICVGREAIDLAVGVTLIGNDDKCPIAITGVTVSRKHARIHWDGIRLVIEDLGSRIGTRVNGVQIAGLHTLRDGDRIGIGKWELTVMRAEATSGEWSVVGARSEPRDVRDERWSLGMLVEMLGKATQARRTLDAERLMRSAAALVEDRLQQAKPVEPEELRALAEAAAWLARASRTTAWSGWVKRVRKRLREVQD
jgi:pSer/pThr/pTyr-binding forkhead associated (FHA) protein